MTEDTQNPSLEPGDAGWAGTTVALISFDRSSMTNKRLATISLQDEMIGCDDPDLLEQWIQNGIVGRADKGTLYPRDGQAFLDELPFAYRGTYLWAEPTDGKL